MYKKLVLFTVMACTSLVLKAQTFYDIDTIQKIEIQFFQTNWDYILDTANAGSEGYLIDQYVKINGIQFDSVGVKYKGNSSYSATRVKNPLHIELNTIRSNADYQGFTDIKLSNVFSDPSMVREALGYSILANYMDAPRANFAQVYINGTLIGFYTNCESIDKKFIGDHYFSSGNTNVKCNPDTPGPSSTSNLVYLGTDSASYYPYYELRSSIAWKDLIRFTDTLANNSSSLDTILDIDRAIWMIAFNNVLVNLDSYTGAFSQNYYLYMDNNGRFVPTVWDLNMSFGGFGMTGIGGPLSVTQMQNLTPTLHATSSNRPLIQKLLADPTYRRMYIAHMRTINNEFFMNGQYVTDATYLRTVADTAVQSDPNAFFTYTQFQNAMTTSYTSGPMTIPGLSQLMGSRSTYLNSTTEFSYSPPVITSVATSPVNPNFNSTVTVTANVTNTNSAAVYLGYRYYTPDRFYRIQMFDDGAHGDGGANDNVYGVSIPVSSALIDYYIYAENANAGMFSPERAEHEFYTIIATVPMAAVGEIVINEFMPVNTSTVMDPAGQYSDWIELFNTSNNPISLGTLFMTDDFTNHTKWAFPVNTVIGPQSYLIIWADQDTTQNGIHANFKLSANGEDLILSYANGVVLDSVTFPAVTANSTWGRYPNGTGPFMQLFPTFAAQNSLTAIVENSLATTSDLFPNPASDEFIIQCNEAIRSLEIMNAVGQIIFSSQPDSNRTTIQVGEYVSGIYFVKINGTETKKLLIQH